MDIVAPFGAAHLNRSQQRWLIGALLFVILAALRLPWREADGGNSTFWAYACFSDDEAAYTSGGRHAWLTGRFLDPQLNEPHTFGGSWGIHFLAWLGYRAAGLTLGAIRWPCQLLAIAAWLAVYVAAARRTPAWLAGPVVFLVSCNPASLTYERICSSDVIVGALVALAWALATARRPAGAFGAGALLALACASKANTYALLPLVLLGAGAATGRRGRRLGLLLAGFVVAFGALWWGRQACLLAASDGRGSGWALAESARWEYSLPRLRYHPADWLKPLSVFPRWQNAFLLGPFVLWALALPAAWVWRWRARAGRWWTRRHAVPLGMLIYTAALALQPNNSLRHYLPLLFFVPLLLIQSRWLLKSANAFVVPPSGGIRSAPPVREGLATPVGEGGRANRRLLLRLAALGLAAALYWFQTERGATPEKVRALMYNDVTVPHNAWTYSGARLAVGWLALTLALGRPWLTNSALALVVVWLFFANYTISLLNIGPDFVINQLLLQLSLATGGAVLLTRSRFWRGWPAWYLLHAAVLLAFVVGNRSWAQAYRELGTRTFYTREASRQLAAELPADAVVIGRRASMLLRNAPVRLGMAMTYPPAEFMAKVAGLLAEHPVFWLVDGDDDLQWERSRDDVHRRWRVSHVTTVQIPSGDLLRVRHVEEPLPFVRIHLMRLQP